ncbi:hypothetical protein JL721_6614 [Aureococcus anophagefferens]|nr:hypothetical protein JL721_6614 [Aureococcus anophagefferens]
MAAAAAWTPRRRPRGLAAALWLHAPLAAAAVTVSHRTRNRVTYRGGRRLLERCAVFEVVFDRSVDAAGLPYAVTAADDRDDVFATGVLTAESTSAVACLDDGAYAFRLAGDAAACLAVEDLDCLLPSGAPSPAPSRAAAAAAARRRRCRRRAAAAEHGRAVAAADERPAGAAPDAGALRRRRLLGRREHGRLRLRRAVPAPARRTFDASLQEYTAYALGALDVATGAYEDRFSVAVDVTAAALLDGGSFGYYVLGAVGGALCRIGESGAACFAASLASSPDAAAVVGDRFYYAEDLGGEFGAIYWVDAVTAAEPFFEETYLAVAEDVFDGSIGDLAAVEDPGGYVSDDAGDYLFGLASDFRVLVVKLHPTERRPATYAVLPGDVDWAGFEPDEDDESGGGFGGAFSYIPDGCWFADADADFCDDADDVDVVRRGDADASDDGDGLNCPAFDLFDTAAPTAAPSPEACDADVCWADGSVAPLDCGAAEGPLRASAAGVSELQFYDEAYGPCSPDRLCLASTADGTARGATNDGRAGRALVGRADDGLHDDVRDGASSVVNDGEPGGTSYFQVRLPITVGFDCWNDGTNNHEACDSSTATVERRGAAAAASGDGLNCPDADFGDFFVTKPPTAAPTRTDRPTATPCDGVVCWADLSVASLDCSTSNAPLQVWKASDATYYEVGQIDVATGNLDLLYELTFVEDKINAVGLFYDVDAALYVPFGVMDERLCRFDAAHAVCFGGDLAYPTANAGAVLGSNFYYSKSPGDAGSESFYWVEDIHTDAPVFHNDDPAFLISASLFAGKVLDVAPVDEIEAGVVLVVKLDDGGAPAAYAVLGGETPDALDDESRAESAAGFGAAWTYLDATSGKPVLVASENSGFGVFVIQYPLVVADDCWNTGDGDHVACDETAKLVYRVPADAAEANDGMNCPLVDLRTQAPTVAPTINCVDRYERVCWADAGVAPFDCSDGAPVQIQRGGDAAHASVIKHVPLDNFYDYLFEIDYFAGNVNAAALLELGGDAYAMAAFDDRLCRFDADGFVCFNGTLAYDYPNAAAMVGTTYYYSKSPGKNTKAFYFVENVHGDVPTFVDDYELLISPDLFSESLGDVAPLVERNGVAEAIDDGVQSTYLLGLGHAFELVVVRLDGDGRYPDAYAVLASDVDYGASNYTFDGDVTFGAAFGYELADEDLVVFGDNDGYGFSLGLPLTIPADCWNNGLLVELHAVCGTATASLAFVHAAHPFESNDGFNCATDTNPFEMQPPSLAPTASPAPTVAPTASFAPTDAPTTAAPSTAPTTSLPPTAAPSPSPTSAPSLSESDPPTAGPTSCPSAAPTVAPTMTFPPTSLETIYFYVYNASCVFNEHDGFNPDAFKGETAATICVEETVVDVTSSYINATDQFADHYAWETSDGKVHTVWTFEVVLEVVVGADLGAAADAVLDAVVATLDAAYSDGSFEATLIDCAEASDAAFYNIMTEAGQDAAASVDELQAATATWSRAPLTFRRRLDDTAAPTSSPTCERSFFFTLGPSRDCNATDGALPVVGAVQFSFSACTDDLVLVFTELLVSNLGVATDDVDAWCGGGRRRRLEDAATVAISYSVTYDASFDGDDDEVLSLVAAGDADGLAAKFEAELSARYDGDFDAAMTAQAEALADSGAISRGSFYDVRNATLTLSCQLVGTTDVAACDARRAEDDEDRSFKALDVAEPVLLPEEASEDASSYDDDDDDASPPPALVDVLEAGEDAKEEAPEPPEPSPPKPPPPKPPPPKPPPAPPRSARTSFKRSKFVEPERTPVLYRRRRRRLLDDGASASDAREPAAAAPPPASAPRTEFIDVPPPPPVPRGFGPPAQAFPTPPGSAPVYQRRSPRRLFI